VAVAINAVNRSISVSNLIRSTCLSAIAIYEA
jgi:hypothetical protein